MATLVALDTAGPLTAQGRRSGVADSGRFLLPHRVEVDRRLRPGNLSLGGELDAVSPMVVDDLVAGDETEVLCPSAAARP